MSDAIPTIALEAKVGGEWVRIVETDPTENLYTDIYSAFADNAVVPVRIMEVYDE